MEFYFDDGIYLSEAKLGSGRYGTVWAVQAKNDPKVRRAVKIYSLQDENKLNEEISILEKLGPNDPDKLIVRSFGKGKSKDGEPCLLMELAEGKPFYRLAQELREVQKREGFPSEFNELFRIRLIVQVCKALDIALSLQIALTDLKLDNFFYEEKSNELVVKVVDWNIVDTKQPPVAFRKETMPRLASAFYELFTGNSLEISPRVVDLNLLGLKQLGQSWPDYWCNLTFETRSILYEMAFGEWKDGERLSLQLWRRWETHLQFWEQRKAENYRDFLSNGVPVGEIQNISVNDLLTSIDIFRLDRVQKIPPDNLNFDSQMLLWTQNFIANLVKERNFQRASIELRRALRIWPGNFLLATWQLFVRLGEVKPSASMYLIHIHPLTSVIENLWRTRNYPGLINLLEDVRQKFSKNWSDPEDGISNLIEKLLTVTRIYLNEQEFEKAIQSNDYKLALSKSGDITNLLITPQQNISPFLTDDENVPSLGKILASIRKFPEFVAATNEIKNEQVKDFVNIDAWRDPLTANNFKQVQEDINASLRIPWNLPIFFEEQKMEIEALKMESAKILGSLTDELHYLLEKYPNEIEQLRDSTGQIEEILSTLIERINAKTVEKNLLLRTIDTWNPELENATEDLKKVKVLITQLDGDNNKLIIDIKKIIGLLNPTEKGDTPIITGGESLAFLLEELKSLVDNRKNSVNLLVTKTQDLIETCNLLSVDVKKADDLVKTVKDEVDLLERKIKELAKQLAELLTSIGKLEIIINNARSRLVKVYRHLFQSRRVVAGLENRITMLEGNIKLLEDTRISQLGEMVSKTQTNFVPVRKNALNLWKTFRQVKAISDMVANESKDFDKIPDDINDIQKTYENAKRQLKKLIPKRKELNSPAEDTSPKVAELRISYLQLIEIKIGSLEEKLQLANNLIRNIDVADTDPDLQEYQQKVNTISDDFDTLKKRFLEMKDQDVEINIIQNPQQDLEQLLGKIEACTNQLLSLVEVLLRIIARPVNFITPDPDIREKVRSLEERLTQIEIDLKSLIFSLGNRVDILSQKIDREFMQWKTWQPRIIAGFLFTIAVLTVVGYFGVTLPYLSLPIPEATLTSTVTDTAVPTTEPPGNVEFSPTSTETAIPASTPTGIPTFTPTPTSLNNLSLPGDLFAITGIIQNNTRLFAETIYSRLAKDKNGYDFQMIAGDPVTVIGRNMSTSFLLVKTVSGLAWMRTVDGNGWDDQLEKLPETVTCVYTNSAGQDGKLQIEPNGAFVVQDDGSPVLIYSNGTFIVLGIDETAEWIQLKIGEILGWLPSSTMSLCSSNNLPTVTP